MNTIVNILTPISDIVCLVSAYKLWPQNSQHRLLAVSCIVVGSMNLLVLATKLAH